MKRIITLLSALVILASGLCSAQNLPYKPTDVWPYEYDSFTEGRLYRTGNLNDVVGRFNVCIANGQVHYLDEQNIILEADSREIRAVEIGEDMYINCFGKMYEIVERGDYGYIVRLKSINNTPEGVDIGFGITSSTVAAQSVDLASAIGISAALVHSNVAKVALEKENGTPLNLNVETFIKVGDHLVPASKQDVIEATSKDAANAFLKAHKVKWNQPETLVPLIDFLAENLQ